MWDGGRMDLDRIEIFFWFWSNGMKHETGTSIREEESERMRLLETVAMLFESFFFSRD